MLDVLGLNYAEGRYAARPRAVPAPRDRRVGDLSVPDRDAVADGAANPNVIGDFTWTGWDYLGEVGIGATAYAEDPTRGRGAGARVPVPDRVVRRPRHHRLAPPGQSFYREIVFGLRTEPYIAVRRPEHTTTRSPAVAVGLERLGRARGPGPASRATGHRRGLRRRRGGRAAAGRRRGGAAAVGGRAPDARPVGDPVRARGAGGGRPTARIEVGRTSLTTAGDPQLVRLGRPIPVARRRLRPGLRVDRAARPDGRLGDELRPAGHRRGRPAPRCWPGLCSANPKTAERFDATTWRTFDGRALAVVRPRRSVPSRSPSRPTGLTPAVLTLEVS